MTAAIVLATPRFRAMKLDTLAVLLDACRFHKTSKGAWFRPRQIGGTASNRCACHLHGLITRGLVERRDAAPGGWRENKLWEYRITDAGIEEAAS